MTVYDRKIKYASYESRHYPPCPARPDRTNYSTGFSESGRITDIKRPQGPRPKPANLLDNLTILGHRESKITRHRYLRHTFQDSVNCTGIGAINRTQLYRINYLMDEVPATLSEPSTAIDVLRKIKEVRVSLAENIGEWRESARAVSGGASALSNAAKDFARLARSPKSRWPSELRRMWKGRAPKELNLHTVTGAYVATQYGILPYIDLANASVEQLLKKANGVALLKRIVCRRKAEVTTEIAGAMGGTLRKRHEIDVKSIVYVSYYMDIGNFDPGNIGESIWAGLPASFMIDWFYGIGQWLSVIDALDGVRSMKGTTSVRHRWVNHDDRLQLYRAKWAPALEIKGQSVGHSYRRDWVNVSMPPLPEWRPSASWGKLMSSLALLDVLRHKR